MPVCVCVCANRRLSNSTDTHISNDQTFEMPCPCLLFFDVHYSVHQCPHNALCIGIGTKDHQTKIACQIVFIEYWQCQKPYGTFVTFPCAIGCVCVSNALPSSLSTLSFCTWGGEIQVPRLVVFVLSLQIFAKVPNSIEWQQSGECHRICRFYNESREENVVFVFFSF